MGEGRVLLRTRAAFTIIQDSDVTKRLGQEDIAQVAGLDNALAERVVSRPPSGFRQVFNIYWDTANEEFIIEISEEDA